MDKVLLWLQEKTMDSIPKPMEVQVLENSQEQEDFYHTLRYFLGIFKGVLAIGSIATTCVMRTKVWLTLRESNLTQF